MKHMRNGKQHRHKNLAAVDIKPREPFTLDDDDKTALAELDQRGVQAKIAMADSVMALLNAHSQAVVIAAQWQERLGVAAKKKGADLNDTSKKWLLDLSTMTFTPNENG